MAGEGGAASPCREDLIGLAQLTTALYRRNKNQHGHSYWFKLFGIFRRQMRNLVTTGISSSLGASARQSEFNLAGLALLRTWHNRNFVPLYEALTQALAEPRFSPLALTLLIIVAKVYRLTSFAQESSDGPDGRTALPLKHVGPELHLEEKVDSTLSDGSPQNRRVYLANPQPSLVSTLHDTSFITSNESAPALPYLDAIDAIFDPKS